MSRIDEALRQAGVHAPASSAAAEPHTGLDSFPVTPEPAAYAENYGQEPVSDSVASGDTLTLSGAAKLVIHGNAEAVIIEQYRRLAAVLHQAQVDRGLKVVMVASAQSAEGKTLTAANLALTLSESYRRRVLLVDADLRRPALGRMFGVASASGLAECLKADEVQQLRIMNISPSLGFLPAGAADHDPMSGLTSGRMQQIIDQAAASFDWVILDTPPVGLLTDAHLLAAMVHAAVLVIDAGTTQHAAVQRAIESIGREKIVGVVLNRVEDKVLAETAYYAYYRDPAHPRRRRGYLSGREMVPGASGTTR
jgi:protein-tyrosine kinase